jgi:uncharacterized protein (UPF0210 family)
MKIRSITYFCNPGWPLDEEKIGATGGFLAEAKTAFESAGYEVQTTRLASVPFPLLLGEAGIEDAPRLAEQLESAIQQAGIAYASLGPALPDFPQSYAVIPEALAAAQDVFFSGVMADKRSGLSLAAGRACANVIVRTAPITPDGFSNLRFAALANVKSGSPFFPAAYHEGDQPAFAIATEAADLAVAAFGEMAEDGRPRTIDEARQRLISEIEKHGQAITRVAEGLSRFPHSDSRSPNFGGIDFSLAPFPADERSLGRAVECLGVPKIGLHGSLAAAAILTEAIERADFPRLGFSGFMQPVLEDSVLATRAAEGLLTVKDLLLYSAVCGTGLDAVPLPGDVTADQIAALLLDLAALALRLDKPLTARLMPIPGKAAGDPTEFEFGYFANSRVMRLEAESLKSSLGGDTNITLKAR